MQVKAQPVLLTLDGFAVLLVLVVVLVVYSMKL
jgi:hypothetical protein